MAVNDSTSRAGKYAVWTRETGVHALTVRPVTQPIPLGLGSSHLHVPSAPPLQAPQQHHAAHAEPLGQDEIQWLVGAAQGNRGRNQCWAVLFCMCEN